MSKRIKKQRVSGVKTEYSLLRAGAEKFLNDSRLKNSSEYDKEKYLFQELQVHQIELEMQNDELRIANIELERQRGKFSGFYDLAPVGYFILDPSGLIKDVNNTGANLLETTKAAIVGKRLQSFITPDDSDNYYRFFTRMTKAAGVQRCTLKIKPAGASFYAQLAGISRAIPDDQTEYYIAVIDISDRINAEKELAETKERLELSLKASLAGTWELDLTTMNFFLDESSQRICNMRDGGFAGNLEDFLKLIHPEDRAEVENRFRKSMNNYKEIDVTCRFGRRDNKECYTVIRGHLVAGNELHDRFVGIILDITEKTQMERSASQLRDEYQKRIAAAMMSTEENERKRISESLHDSVSQLLYGIKIHLDQLEKSPPSLSNLRNIKRLLDQAIDETRNISFELAPSILADFGLPATIEELAKRLSSKDLKVRATIAGFFKRVDLLLETNIYRIVQELVNNSMKHSGASQINIDITKNKSIEIIVKDNGKGYNVKEQESSTSGSGLASIKNRLRIHNGNITIESERSKGTTVRVELYEDLSDLK